jgi:glucose-6-phosphate isomerase
MIYTQDISGALEEAVGKDGAGSAEFAEALARANDAVARLREHKKNNTLPVLSIAEREDDIALIEETAKRISGFKAFVVIGMGGSSYGGKALAALSLNPFAHGSGTEIHFLDNIDPLTSDRVLLLW